LKKRPRALDGDDAGLFPLVGGSAFVGSTVDPALDLEIVGCIVRRMPRMQVYLPDDLYRSVKKRQLPASELLQKAVRAELRRLDLLAESDRYLRELVAQVGEPTETERSRANMLAGRIARRARRKVG
jgi:hypothetical protein